jgi:WD40 repeat protein
MEEPLPKKFLSPFMTALKKGTENSFVQKQLACYVPARAKKPISHNPFDLMAQILNFVGHPEQRTALLMGDSGGGKTLFGQHLIKSLWEAFDESVSACQIPLWIDLTSIENPGENLLKKHLLKLCPLEEVDKELSIQWPVLCERLLQTKSFFLVLDGADEINFTGNLFEANDFAVKRVQILTTCRTSALRAGIATRSLFGFPPVVKEEEQHKYPEFPEYEILPFEKPQQLKFLQLYIQHYLLTPSWTEAQFIEKLEELVNVEELTANPYCLFLALEELPEAVAKHAQEKDRVKRVKFTRHYIYKRYVEHFFERQRAKLVVKRNEQVHALINKANESRLPDEQLSLIDLFRGYCERLAQTMHEHGVKQIRYKPVSEVKIKTLPDIIMEGSLSPAAVASSKKEPQDEDEWLKEFFDDKANPGLVLIRLGCPLRQVRSGEWAFFHPSLLDYFIAERLFNSAMLDAEIMTGHNLNADNLQNKPDILKFLVDVARENDEFVKVLFQIIELAKHEPQAWKASANAGTILNYAGKILTKQNFRRGRFGGVDEKTKEPWGADFSNSNLYRTDASESDFRFVKLHEADVSHLNLSSACVTGLNLGEKPPAYGALVNVSEDGTWFVTRLKKMLSVDVEVSIIDYQSLSILNKIVVRDCHTRTLIILNPQTVQVAMYYRYNWHAICLLDKVKSVEVKIPAKVVTLRYSPDGKQLALLDKQKQILLIDTNNGVILKKIPMDDDIKSMIFSPRGHQLAILKNNVVTLVETQGQQVKTTWGIGHFVAHNIYYSADESRLILEGTNDVNMMAVASGGITSARGSTLNLHHPHKNRILSFDMKSKVLRRWNQEKGIVAIKLDLNEEVYQYCFSPDGKQLVTLQLKSFSQWSTEDGSCQVVLDSNVTNVHYCPMQYSPTGNQFAIGKGTEVHLWDCKTWTLVHVLEHSETIEMDSGLIYHPHQPQIFLSGRSLSSGGSTRIWDAVRSRNVLAPQGTFFFHLYHSNGLCLKHDNENLYLQQDGSSSIIVCENKILMLALSSDGQYLAALFEGAGITVWDAVSKKQVATFSNQEKTREDYMPRPGLMFRPDNKQIAYFFHVVLSEEQQRNLKIKTESITKVQLWNIDNVKRMNLYETEGDELISSLNYNPDGSQLAVITSKKKFIFFDTNTGQQISSHVHSDFFNQVDAIRYASNGKKFIALHRSWKFKKMAHYFCIWDRETMKYEIISDELRLPSDNDFLVVHSFEFDPSQKLLSVAISKWGGGPPVYLGFWDIAAKKWLTMIEIQERSFESYWISNERKIRIRYSNGVQMIWQIGSSDEDTYPIWTSHSSFSLQKNQLQISNCYGLDSVTLRMLQYTDPDKRTVAKVIGTPNQTRKVEDVLEEREKQVHIPAGFIRVDLPEGNIRIDKTKWLVSLVRKRQPLRKGFNPLADRSAHVSLIIQGITDNNYSYVKEVHLFLDQSEPNFCQAIGTGLIQVRDKSPHDLESQVFRKQYVAKSVSVIKTNVMNMLVNIEQDQKQKIDYLISGYSPGLFGSRPAYNCLTWCEYHLRKADIGIVGKEGDLFCAFPTEHLPDPEQPESCLTM